MQRYVINIPGFAASYPKWEQAIKNLNEPYIIIKWFKGLFTLLTPEAIEKLFYEKKIAELDLTLLYSSDVIVQASEMVANEIILNKDKTIVILAHSMGTMIAVKSLSLLTSRSLPPLYVVLMSGVANIDDLSKIPSHVMVVSRIFNFFLEKDKVLQALKMFPTINIDPIGLKPVSLKSIVNIDASKIGIQEHTDYVNNLKRVYEAIFALNS